MTTGQIYLPQTRQAAQTHDVAEELEEQKLESETQFAEAQTNLQDDQERKANPRLGVGGPVMDKPKSFFEFALQLAQRALDRMMEVRGQLDAKGVNLAAEMLAKDIEILDEVMKSDEGVVSRALPLMKETPHIELGERVRFEMSEQLALSKEELDQATEMIEVAAKKGGDDVKVALKKQDIVARCIGETLRMTTNIEHTLRFLARRTSELNDTLEQVLHLEQLVRRYQNVDELDIDATLQTLRAKDPNTLTPEEHQMLADLPEMAQLIEVARDNGVLWDQSGWESKEDRERYLKGLAACVGMLQTRSKRGDLETQQAMQSFATHVILATTLIKMQFDLLKEVSRNIHPR